MDYLELLKLTLTAAVYPESAYQYIGPRSESTLRAMFQRTIVKLLNRRGITLIKRTPYDRVLREGGRDWPSIGYTMVGLKRLQNVWDAIETIVREGVEGDFVETGVWRGGCSIFARACLNVYGEKNRLVWACDSYEGLPKPDVAKYSADAGYDLSQNDYLSVPLPKVQENFRTFGLSEGVRFIKGWFRDSLPTAPIGKIAVLRLDGDLYESTMDALKALYDHVSPGGFVVVDDYGAWPPCKKAVHDFRDARGITNEIIDVDGIGAFWRVG
ncbi:MAG TPA: TylF/MycF/NovP-related O-methyltransferase [Tepidisphaeraceae bacterium]|jgi:O-methyltransferase|nr:TylF/MycF/NovP-related O-methyltransferase [Tepidisphaeraceae bacterium]